MRQEFKIACVMPLIIALALWIISCSESTVTIPSVAPSPQSSQDESSKVRDKRKHVINEVTEEDKVYEKHVPEHIQGEIPQQTTSSAPSSTVQNKEIQQQAPPVAKNENPADLPTDFDFKLNYGIFGYNCVDTYQNTFTKDLIEPEETNSATATIELTIPPEKMLEIYNKFVEYKISDLPDDINADVKIHPDAVIAEETPGQEYALTYTCAATTRTIIYDGAKPWPEKDAPNTRDRLIAFTTFVSDYIYSTPEYTDMPPEVGGYM